MSRLTHTMRSRVAPFLRGLLSGRAAAPRPAPPAKPVTALATAQSHVRLISADPLIVMWCWVRRTTAPDALSTMPPALRLAPSCLLTQVWWSLDDADARAAHERMLAAAPRSHPGARIVTLCNTEADCARLVAGGHEAVFVSHNAFADERMFRPEPQAVAFDAVYNAAFTPWKRHALASAIDRLALIGYARAPHAALAAIRSALPAATLLNPVEGDGVAWLGWHDVNAALNRARVGLCLSAAEGAMFASIEYLLAGLPIVSTPSTGGRDVFFDPDYCLVVPPDPRAVRDGVQALIARNVPRALVRERTLRRIAAHRARFVALVQSLLAAHDPHADFAASWPTLHRHLWLEVFELDAFWRDVEARRARRGTPG